MCYCCCCLLPAAAAGGKHHTVVVTRDGHSYGFGLNSQVGLFASCLGGWVKWQAAAASGRAAGLWQQQAGQAAAASIGQARQQWQPRQGWCKSTQRLRYQQHAVQGPLVLGAGLAAEAWKPCHTVQWTHVHLHCHLLWTVPDTGGC
jgi:hypothetical protein